MPRLVSVHSALVCGGTPCPFHDPSEHHMRDWPIVVRASGLTERTCTHGVGHPDPDSLAWLASVGRTDLALHGCDGCCRGGAL